MAAPLSPSVWAAAVRGFAHCNDGSASCSASMAADASGDFANGRNGVCLQRDGFLQDGDAGMIFRRGGADLGKFQILDREEDDHGGGRLLFEASAVSQSSCSSPSLLTRRLRVMKAEAVVIASPPKPWELAQTVGATGRGATACVSSQAGGCPLDCSFCDTGTLPGPVSNLPAWAIVAQVHAARRFNPAVRRVTFMGMGEPLLNYTEVSAAITELQQDDELRRPWAITVSTVGVVPRIARLAADHPKVALAISLHAADSALRARLLPASSARWSLESVVQAAWEHQAVTGRPPMFAYTVLPGVNDSETDADNIARLLMEGRVDGSAQRPFVNLVPYNRTAAGEAHGFRSPTRQQMQTFRTVLRARGVRATVRWSTADGRPLTAACGQLVAGAAGEKAVVVSENSVARRGDTRKNGSDGETTGISEEAQEHREHPLARLTRKLHRAKSIEEVLSLAEASAHEMNAIHASAAFVTLARTAPAAGGKLERDPRFHGLMKVVEGLLPDLSAQAAANVLWALGKVKHRPDTAFCDGLAETSRREMHKFWPQNISNSLWSCATLRLGINTGLVQALVDMGARKASALTPLELTTIFWSLSVLGYWPGGVALRQLAGVVSAQSARSFAARDIITIVRAVIALGLPRWQLPLTTRRSGSASLRS
eukprot:TRINITY_DN30497_c0_g1_i1.p1 TRINITY_DN30497_c0_g1~~TRINITY_DN30497_c0_g1_i1.p1  ORF type:complete len:741 (+),score=107.98 TRINITY_DN30497_c0_g1_i1:257-2224(+)